MPIDVNENMRRPGYSRPKGNYGNEGDLGVKGDALRENRPCEELGRDWGDEVKHS